MNNLLKAFFSARYSKWDDNQAWSSQEWKTDTSMCGRSGQPVFTSWGKTRESQSSFFHEKTQHDGTAHRSEQPVVNPQRGARPQQFVFGNDETELELSVESRSFLNKVNDQVRKRQKRSSMNVTEDGEKHSMFWGMFMSVTMESTVFMRKNYFDNCHSITNIKDLTLKQMFDISTRLASEQDEISGLETIGWENHSWKYVSLIGDERVINLQRTKVYVFSYSVLCLGNILENLQSNDAWEDRLGWFKSSPEYKKCDRIDGEPMEFEWNIFSGFNTLQLSAEVKSLFLRLGETPENFTGRIQFMSMFNDIFCGSRDNEEESLLNGEWDNMAERILLEFAESGCPIFRAKSPLSRGRLKSKGHGKLSIHYAADLETIETFSHNCFCKSAQSLRSSRRNV